MFPDRWPGAGLLLLRLAVGGVLILQGAAFFGEGQPPALSMLAADSAMSVIGFLLLIGFRTRLVAPAAALASMGFIFSWIPASGVGPLATSATSGLSAVIAGALACMGAGAFSLDALLFGRREIVIPVSYPDSSREVESRRSVTLPGSEPELLFRHQSGADSEPFEQPHQSSIHTREGVSGDGGGRK